jgi:hypothetical protein
VEAESIELGHPEGFAALLLGLERSCMQKQKKPMNVQGIIEVSCRLR